MILVGGVRPALNAGVNHAFGAEWTGHAAVVVSLIFVASQLATAGLPTAAVVHVGRAHGAKDRDRAAAVARFGQVVLLVLAAAGTLGALAYVAWWRDGPTLSRLDAILVGAGVFAYAQWRYARSVLFASGLASKSLAADFVSVAGAAVLLGGVIIYERPSLAPSAYVAVYAVFSLATLPRMISLSTGGTLDPASRRELLTYAAFWIVSTTAANVTADLATLVVDARVDRARVGELAVALSFLIPLGFAPRVLDLPLIQEFSRLEGERDALGQRDLTSRATHWLGVLLLAVGPGGAILAGPVLALAGGVHDPEVVTVFAALCLSFSVEVLQMPASSLVASRDHPAMQVAFGIAPLFLGAVVWIATPSAGILGVGAGMAVVHVSKALMFTGWIRWKHGVRVAVRPIAKILVLSLGLVLAVLARTGAAHPFAAFAAFEAVVLVVFLSDLKAMLRAAR